MAGLRRMALVVGVLVIVALPVGMYAWTTLDDGPLALQGEAGVCTSHGSDESYTSATIPLTSPDDDLDKLRLITVRLIGATDLQVSGWHLHRAGAGRDVPILGLGLEVDSSEVGTPATFEGTAEGVEIFYRSGWRFYRVRQPMEFRVPVVASECRPVDTGTG